MSLMAAQRIKVLLILMDHSGVHRGLTADAIGKITASEDRAERTLMEMQARREVHCAGDLWYIDPIYSENNKAKFLPARDLGDVANA